MNGIVTNPVQTIPQAIPGVVSALSLMFDRTLHTDPAVVVSAFMEYSEDGGLSWRYGGGFTAPGDAGLTSQFAGLASSPLFRSVTNPLVRATYTVTGGALAVTPIVAAV